AWPQELRRQNSEPGTPPLRVCREVCSFSEFDPFAAPRNRAIILTCPVIKEVFLVRSFFRPGLAILTAALLMASIARALDVPLSDEAVREAYFLGQHRDDRTAQFLETYRRYFPVPKSGPHVFAIELFTPYAEAVEASSKHGLAYSAQQAWLDYQA